MIEKSRWRNITAHVFFVPLCADEDSKTLSRALKEEGNNTKEDSASVTGSRGLIHSLFVAIETGDRVTVSRLCRANRELVSNKTEYFFLGQFCSTCYPEQCPVSDCSTTVVLIYINIFFQSLCASVRIFMCACVCVRAWDLSLLLLLFCYLTFNIQHNKVVRC